MAANRTEEDAALRSRLIKGLRALGELPAAPEDAARVVQQLLDYLALIGRWNRVYNLTAVRDPGEMLTQHLLDSVAAVPPMARALGERAETLGPQAAERVLDVGSGAGLPGVVVAILRPAWSVHCVDAVAKKASFIRQVATELRLAGLHAHHSRVEDLAMPPFGLVTSRAFASLEDFVALTRSHLAPGGVWMAMKGRVPDDELAALPDGVDLLSVEALKVPGLDAQRCLVWLQPGVGG